MIDNRRKESFKKNKKVDVDNYLNANVYFPPEDVVGGCSKTLVYTGWTTSHLTLSKYVNGLTDFWATMYSPNRAFQYPKNTYIHSSSAVARNLVGRERLY
jgi:hypothetical protein